MSHTCKNCGQPVPGAARVCPNCGEDTPRVWPPAVPFAPERRPFGVVTKSEAMDFWLGFAIGVLGPVLGFAIGYWILDSAGQIASIITLLIITICAFRIGNDMWHLARGMKRGLLALVLTPLVLAAGALVLCLASIALHWHD